MKSSEVKAIVAAANSYLSTLGLKTKVVLSQGNKLGKLDKTDNWAVIGTDRKAVAEKTKSITNDHHLDHVEHWAGKDGDPYNPEVSNGSINSRGIAIDHSAVGNIGTQEGNANPDAIGGSAITLIHAASHSSSVIQGNYGKVGLGGKDGHMPTGVAANGNKLVESFNKGGAKSILAQDNAAFIKAMEQRYGTKEAHQN